jgi:hypothetical protein
MPTPEQHDIPALSAYAYQKATSLVPAVPREAHLLQRRLGRVALPATRRAGAAGGQIDREKAIYRKHQSRSSGQAVGDGQSSASSSSNVTGQASGTGNGGWPSTASGSAASASA